MSPWSKSAKALRVVLALLTLSVAWVGFQLGTHRHTGILRALVEAKHFLSEVSLSSLTQQRSVSTPTGPQHNVSLSWKASNSPVIGYNVYRGDGLGLSKLNSAPVTETTYVDRTVQPGQTYRYVTKAVTAKGTESSASNEVRVDIPSDPPSR
jgi:fibronectin type 3 domain-containing protein